MYAMTASFLPCASTPVCWSQSPFEYNAIQGGGGVESGGEKGFLLEVFFKLPL